MKDFERTSKMFDFALSVAKSKLNVDQKKIGEIETEAINALIGFKVAIENLDNGCKIITSENTKNIV